MSTEPDITGGDEIDPTPYIRTFAKDFAALSGKDLDNQSGAGKKKKNKKIKPPKPPKKEKFSSQLQTQDTGIEQEVDNNLKQLSAGGTSSVPNSIELPKIASGDIVSQVPVAPISPENSSEILARLKARAAENKDKEISVPASPVSPTPAPISQSSLMPTKAPAPLHTFTSDFQDHIKEEHASKFSVLAAQKDAHIKTQVPAKKHGAGVLMTTAAIILIIAGGGVVFAAYSYIHKNQPMANIQFASSIITPDSRILLAGSGTALLTALAQQAAQPLPDNTVELAYVNESTTTAQGVVEEPASGGAFITELNLQAPDILLRNIDPSSVVGIVSAGGETSPFFVLRVTSYERTFAGMLQWEPTLYEQLSTLYPAYPAAPQTPVASAQTESSTSSSTNSSVANVSPPVSTGNIPAAQFIDETVASHDARALKDNSGRTIVLYGYADKQTLIIARNEDAFTLLLNRLTASTN